MIDNFLDISSLEKMNFGTLLSKLKMFFFLSFFYESKNANVLEP